jgi:hypothetical protein
VSIRSARQSAIGDPQSIKSPSPAITPGTEFFVLQFELRCDPTN